MLLLSQAFPGMYLVRVVQGFAFALSFNSITTLATDGVPSERLGRVLALFGTSLLVTQALAPAMAEAIALLSGWQAVFWVSAGFGVLSIASALLFLSEPEASRMAVTVSRASASLWSAVAGHAQILSAVSAAGAGFGTLITFSQPFALQRGIERVSGFFVAYALCAVAVRFVAIGFLERTGRRQVSAASLLVYGVAVAATAWLRPGALEVIGAVVGVAHGVFYPVCNALALELVSSAERGSMMALYHGGFNAGFAVAALVGGTVAAHVGYPALFLGTAALVSVAAANLFRAPTLA
jgi:MFS family permease